MERCPDCDDGIRIVGHTRYTCGTCEGSGKVQHVPHRITVKDVESFMSLIRSSPKLSNVPQEGRWTQMSEAETADDTQIKCFEVSMNPEEFRVSRMYLEEPISVEPETVYKGTDMAEAIRLYNQLS